MQRKRRIRSRVSGTAEIPRLSVFKSLKGLYAQVIDDQKGVTLSQMRVNQPLFWAVISAI